MGLCDWVFSRLPGFGGQSIRPYGSPDQKMGIQQQFRFLPLKRFSMSAFPIWSNSSGTRIWPARKPSRRAGAWGAASRPVTLTSGFPALAMTKESPRTAAAIKRESWVLASWILTVFIAGEFKLRSFGLAQAAQLVSASFHCPGKRPAGKPAGLLASSSKAAQWNCSSSVDPVKAVTLDLPP